MTDDGTRQERIRRAAERAAGSLASGEDLIDPGSLAETLSGFVLADVPDATSAEIQSAFASLWGIRGGDRRLHDKIFSVCEKHRPREGETIRHVLERAARAGDLDAIQLLRAI